MLFDPQIQGQLAQERIERDIAKAALLRASRQPAPSIRQAIGRRFIQIGARLAAEPSREPIRSR
jgi:hypothetical protein